MGLICHLSPQLLVPRASSQLNKRAPWGGTPARGTHRSQRMLPELKRRTLGRGRPLRCLTTPTSWVHRERGCCRGLGSQGRPAACELPWGARRRRGQKPRGQCQNQTDRGPGVAGEAKTWVTFRLCKTRMLVMTVGCPCAEQKQASWGHNQERATEGTGPGDRSTVSEQKDTKNTSLQVRLEAGLRKPLCSVHQRPTKQGHQKI